jgi:hypothetical protein
MRAYFFKNSRNETTAELRVSGDGSVRAYYGPKLVAQYHKAFSATEQEAALANAIAELLKIDSELPGDLAKWPMRTLKVGGN